MNFIVTELNYYRRLADMLKANGFGLVEAVDPYNPDSPESVLNARIWMRVNEEGIPSGAEVGTLEKQLGHAGRYTLTLNDFYLGRERIHGLLTDILNLYVRAEQKPKEKAE